MKENTRMFRPGKKRHKISKINRLSCIDISGLHPSKGWALIYRSNDWEFNVNSYPTHPTQVELTSKMTGLIFLHCMDFIHQKD